MEHSIKAGVWNMARRRTGERPALTRRWRFWNGVKNQAKKIREIRAADWAKAGLFVAAVLWGLWTKSIDFKSNQNREEIAKLQAANAESNKQIDSLKWAAAAKEVEFKVQLVTVNSRVDACEKAMKERDEKLRRIRNAAKTLRDGPAKQEIMDLTKEDANKSGAVKPMRADDSIPSMELLVPFDWRNVNE